MIAFTDIVILDKQNKFWENGISTLSKGTVFHMFAENDDNLIDPQELREHHAYIMENGITEIDNNAQQIAILPPPISSLNTTVAVAPVLEPIEAIEDESFSASSIEPAAGRPMNALDEVVRKLVPPQAKTIHDMHKDAAKDVLPLKSKVSYQEVLPAKGDTKEPGTFTYKEPEGNGKVVIIIDDMGVSLRSKLVEVMDGPLTLAYLPYAKDLKNRTKRAKANGHELMVHIPMQAMSNSADGGPRVLSVDLTPQEFKDTLDWGLSQFDGYVGINNHMGSRLTSDKASMVRLMKHIQDKNIFFIDSKTIASSVAAETAEEYGIPYAERDVFLDHEMSIEFVRASLKKLEEKAKRQGYAIAIGHPHAVTIEGLKEWLPTLAEKGLTLVPASDVIKTPITTNDNYLASGQ